jgi:FlaA1/EpsC-like NDP-sugar epimerase
MRNLYSYIFALIKRNRRVVVTLIHLVQAVLANYLAFLIRFEGVIPNTQVVLMASFLPYLLLIRLAFYYRARLYSDLWRYSGLTTMMKIALTVALGNLAFFALVRYGFGNTGYPRSIYILDAMFMVFLSGGMRAALRIVRGLYQAEGAGRRALIVGAGDAGEMIVRDMKQNPRYNYQPIGFLDDDPYKAGLTIRDVPIFGPLSLIGDVVREHAPEEIVIAIPSADRATIRSIYDACKPFNLPIKTLPGMSDILSGEVSVSHIKPLSIEDLLQREPVQYDIESVRELIRGRVVLVSGAGGSIGSELARQIAHYEPERVLLLDRYENGLYQVDLELRDAGVGGRVTCIIGDVLDRARLDQVFARYRPRIVFHAAAHKHVPLMELNPLEAVKNNVFGTRNLIAASHAHGVERFVMISTDKAVNPTNVMGATKRIAEFLARDAASRGATKFTTVRFGNVLGSNGSVLPVFRDQIARGGPVTVTHPDIKRFFMLIPEAVQLVLVAASRGAGGEIFVLEMGEPIAIADFAENLIRLSGMVPHKDIAIVYTGLRPGEKLFEELFDASEETLPTDHPKLRVALGGTPEPEAFARALGELERIVREADEDALPRAIRDIVPGYLPDN